MTSYVDIKKIADENRKQKAYKNALVSYRELWDKYPAQCNQWDLWGLIFCENKMGNYDAALKMSRIAYKKYPDFDKIKQVYSWAIYYLVVKGESKQEAFDKAVKGILKLTDYKDRYGPGALTVLQAATRWNEQKEWHKTIDLLKGVDVSILSQDNFSYTDTQGVSRELASHQERYYAALTKAQIGVKAWQDCLDTARDGLEKVAKFHFGNNIWFRWRMSESYHHLGQYDKAVALLKQIQKTKKEWFFTSAIGTNMLAQKKYKEAKLFFAQACLEKGDWTKKTKVYLSLVELYEMEQEEAAIKNHVALLWHIYKKEDWSMGARLRQLVEKYDVESQKFGDVKSQSRRIWTQVIESNMPSYEGKIVHVLPNQKACFISSKGESYFGSKNDFRGNPDFFRKGQQVLFMITEGYDRKKKKKTQVAIHIRPKNKNA